MSKDKKSYKDNESKDLTFYYEIVGLVSVIISIIGFAQLGKIGNYIYIIFKVTFGDWYFLFLVALLLYGSRSLMLHKPLNIKNMRSVGIIFLLIAIMTLSHFPMHDYVSQFGNNYISMTFDLYLDYIKNYHEGMIVGGGVIGSLFFYCFYMLFSSAGVIIIATIAIFVGVSFTCQKTVFEFSKIIFNGIKRVMIKSGSFFKSLKYDIKKETEPKSKRIRTKKFTIEMLEEPEVVKYNVLEIKHAEEIQKSIISILNNQNCFYQQVHYLISNHVTSYYVCIKSNFNMDSFNLRLKSTLADKFMIRKETNTANFTIEVDNLYKTSVYLKNLLLQCDYQENSLKIPIGIDTTNNVFYHDFNEFANLLIIADNNSNIKVFLECLILALYIKKQKRKISISIYDLKRNISELTDTKICTSNDLNYQEYCKNVDERLQSFSINKCNTIDEYNKSTRSLGKASSTLDDVFVIINNFEVLLLNDKLPEELIYLLQVGPKAGYHFIMRLGEDKYISNIISSLFMTKIFMHNNYQITDECLGIEGLEISNEEGIYQYRDNIARVSLVSTNLKNIEKFRTIL